MEEKDDFQPSSNSRESEIGQDFKLFFNQQSQQLNPKVVNHDLIPLSETEVGDIVSIVVIQLVNCIDYLHKIGITPGTELQVISITTTGTVVAYFADKCLGLPREMATGIFVRRFS